MKAVAGAGAVAVAGAHTRHIWVDLIGPEDGLYENKC